MMKYTIKLLYRFTVYTTGVAVLLAAVSVTVIRLALPEIGIYRNEIETWLGYQLDSPVRIESIGATWHGWTPLLHLTGIDILDKTASQPLTHFDSAEISIDPFATLIQQRFIPKRLMVSGFSLSVSRLDNGAFHIKGIGNEESDDNLANNKTELAEWLFNQENIEVQQATIEWTDIQHQQEPVLLTDVALVLRNDGDRFQLEGSTGLPSAYGNKMNFAFDATGNLSSSEWSGEFYINASNINPDKWYKKHRLKNLDFIGGKADIRTWTTWRQSKLVKIEGDLRYDNFKILTGANHIYIKESSYSFLGERTAGNGWQLQAVINNLLTENGPWPRTILSLTSEPADKQPYRYTASLNYLKLDDIKPLIISQDFLPDQSANFLKRSNIKGELKNIKLIFDPDREAAQQLTYDTGFDQIIIKPVDGSPHITNLSGRIYGDLSSGIVSINDNSMDLHVNTMDDREIGLTGLHGDIKWSYINGGWSFETGNIKIETPDFSASLAGSISKREDHPSPFLDLIINLGQADVESIADYIPSTPRFKLHDWMKRTILGGHMSSANALFRGHLSDFPFDNHNGRFQAIINVNNGAYEYSNAWPPVDDITAEIILEGREMNVLMRNGKVFNAEIKKGTITVADILEEKKTVVVNGSFHGTTKDLQLLVDQSPLSQQLALKEVRELLQSGDFKLDLGLRILTKQNEIKPDIEGEIELLDTMIKYARKDIQLEKINGKISFSRDSVRADALSATYLGRPVGIAVSGSKTNKYDPTSIVFTGTADESFITDRIIEYLPAANTFKAQMLEHLSGEAPWQVKLLFQRNEEQDKLEKLIEITSDLNGLAIELPEPFDKTRNISSPIKIAMDITDESNPEVNIKYGSIKLHSKKPDNQDDRDIFVSGTIKKISVDEWLEVLKQLKTDPGTKIQEKIAGNIVYQLQLESLDAFGQNYTNVDLAAHNSATDWQLNLVGDNIKGDISVPASPGRSNQIVFNLERLVIEKRPGIPTDKRPDPLNLPGLLMEVGDLVYHDIKLGQVQLKSSSLPNGISIDRFQFNKHALNIEGYGKWVVENGQEKSNFNITLNADYMDAMLDTFGYDLTSVKNGETRLQINAEWSGSPMEFTFDRMSGNLVMDIQRGQFLDIKPAAGRLFGLLSMQTLPRRLSLDFRDLFGQGLAFDEIAGNFDIANGNAYTNDLYLRGPSANVAVTGRTGLSEQDYDQIVTVTPRIAGNLPIAGALFGPVGIGLGTVIYLAGEIFKPINTNIDNLMSHQYTITGSWNNPTIEKIKLNGEVAGG